MTTYVILLRGVTPSGKNKIPVSRFREELEKAGFAHVRTYIQSGNTLVDTELPAHTVEKSVRELIRNTIGPDLAVIVRTGEELEVALEENPFKNGYDISRVFLFLLQNHCRRRKSGNSGPGIFLRKNSHSVKKLPTCISRASTGRECSPVVSWKRSLGFRQQCGISIP